MDTMSDTIQNILRREEINKRLTISSEDTLVRLFRIVVACNDGKAGLLEWARYVANWMRPERLRDHVGLRAVLTVCPGIEDDIQNGVEHWRPETRPRRRHAVYRLKYGNREDSKVSELCERGDTETLSEDSDDPRDVDPEALSIPPVAFIEKLDKSNADHKRAMRDVVNAYSEFVGSSEGNSYSHNEFAAIVLACRDRLGDVKPREKKKRPKPRGPAPSVAPGSSSRGTALAWLGVQEAARTDPLGDLWVKRNERLN